MCLELDISASAARGWIMMFETRGTVALAKGGEGLGYRFVRPLPGGPYKRPRGSDSPSARPHAPVARGAPVAGTGRTSYPAHVERVRSHLRNGVKIEKRGNEHIFFRMAGGKFTWTSHSPKNKDDEYDQLVRRLKERGMWVA